MSGKQDKSLAKVEATTKVGFDLTNSGVMFVGADLLGAKLAAIYCEMIQADELHGLACLTIRSDNFPIEGDKPVFGNALADTNSIAINLEHCWHRACVKADKNDVSINFMGILWVNLLNTLAHELDHLVAANNDREMYELMRSSEDGQKALEESAQAAATPILLRMAKTIDIEIPDAADFGWFGAKLMDLFTNDTTKDLKWVIKARKDMEAGIVYEDAENEIKCLTFREFVKLAYTDTDEERASDIWEQATTAVNLTAYLDYGVVEHFQAEPVEEPKMETVVLETADAPAEAITMVAAANGTFVGAGEVATEPEINTSGADDVANTKLQDKVVQALLDGAKPAPPAEAAVMAAAPQEDILEVPLPAPVAAQQATFAAAAATAVPPEVKTELPYTPHNLSPETQAAVMEQVWKTLYHHIFTKCEWQQNPQTGRFAFMKAGNVLEGVNIQHILTQFGADNFIMEYDTLNANGQGGHSYAAEACQGMIRGRLTSGGLPSYQIYLNIGGHRIRRLFVPQNPEKRGANNAYSPTAEQAGAGNQIAWIFRGEAPDGASFKEKCAVKITNTAAGLVYEVF